MTERKHFKQLVRARMGKTGESYSAARRQLIRQTEVPSASLPPFHHFPGNIPSTTALRSLLAHAGVRAPHTKAPFSEAMVFGLAGGVGAGVFTFHYAKEGFSSFFVAGRHLWQDHTAWALAAASRMGLRTTVKESSGVKPAEKQLRELLAGGRPVLAWLDATRLPMRGGMYHVAAVHAIDDAAGAALLGDLGETLIPVPLPALAEARGRTKKDKYRLLALEPGEKLPDLAVLVRGGIAACAAALAKGKMKNFTLEAFATWADRLAGSTAADSWEKLFPPGPNLYRALTGISEYVEYYGTGGGLCRPMFAEFLEEAGQALGDRELGRIGAQYSELGEGWSALADAALPGEVPLFQAAKERLARRAELLTTQDSETEPGLAQCGQQSDEALARMKQDFPLNVAESAALRAQLKVRVAALYEGEVAALGALQKWVAG